MALKYWFKVSGGSDNWATAANWYNGSGGTGGLAGVPTAADDVIIDDNSGSGTITIAAAATCLSLDCTSFVGTLAGTSTLAFLGNITLGSSMTLTYSGTATLGNGTSYFTSNGKTVTFNITINNAGAALILVDNLTMTSTNTLTLSSGQILSNTATEILSVGFFVSTGSAIRIFGVPIYLTGVGTVWNVSGTNFGWVGYDAYITNDSSSAKTISHTPSSAPTGYIFRQTFLISGTGTGAYTLTGNFQNVFFDNTGGASLSFGSSNIAGTIDLGYTYPTCNMIWNNAASQTLTFNADDVQTITIGQNITITSSPALSYTNATGYNATINNFYNKSLTGAITVNSPGVGLYADNLITTGIITLTSGTLQATNVYCSSISTSNANTRTITITDLYLTGTGTLATVTTTTNLTSNITNIYVTNSTVTAKSITLNALFNCQVLFLGGTGSGSITAVLGTSFVTPNVTVTNTGGAVINFSAASKISTLDFGTSNCVWTNTTAAALIYENLILSPNMTIISCPIITVDGSFTSTFIFCNGKPITNFTINDSTNLTNNYSVGGLLVSGAITITSGSFLSQDVNGNPFDIYAATITSTGTNDKNFNCDNLYLTGNTSVITSTSVVGMTFNVNNIILIGSSGANRSVSLNTGIYPLSSLVIAGTGAGTTTVAAGTNATFDIFITNTGGCTISMSTATIKSLEFSVGTNATWNNAINQTLTITTSLSIATSAGNPTSTPPLILTGSDFTGGQFYVTLNGKSLTRTCTLNDSTYSANYMSYNFDGFSSTAAFTVTSASYVYFTGAFSGPSYTSTSAVGSDFNSSLTLTGALSLANNAQPNDVQVNGNFSGPTISHLAIGTITLSGSTNNVTTSITLNNASLAYFTNFGTLTTPTFTITNGSLTSYGNVNCTTFTIGNGNFASYGNLNCTTFTIGNGDASFFNNIVTVTGIVTLTSGTLQSQNTTFSSQTFVCSATANSRGIFLYNSSWTLTSTGTVWNLADGGTIGADFFSSDIYITNTSTTVITFAGANQVYGRLFINRGAINSNQVIITGANAFRGLYHTGGSTQTLTFPAGIDTYIYDTFAVGSSSAVTNISSSSASVPFNIVKLNFGSGTGLVICNNVSITRSSAFPANTWYAINSTNVAGNTEWIFGAPSRRLGVSGAG